MSKSTVYKDEVIQEEIHGSVIEGLKVFVLPKKGFHRKYAELSVHYGSNDNVFVPTGETRPVNAPPGIAHFLEHKMFEKSWGEAFSAFAGIGASANAYTDNNYTSYLVWTVEHFTKALELLIEVAFSPHFTEGSVEKEKGIISQEIRMYRDRPSSRLYSEMLSSLFIKHPVRLDIAGTEDSIQQVTPELLYLCHENFYCPTNAGLYLAGDFDVKEALELVAGVVSKANLRPFKPPSRLRPDEPETVGPDVRVNMPVPTPLVQIGWKDNYSTSGREMIMREVSVTLLLELMFGRSSSFFAKVHEKGLADRLSFSYDAWPDYGFAFVAAESPDPDQLSGLVFGEVDRIRREGIDPKHFLRLKKALKGRFVSLFDSFDAVGRLQIRLSDAGESIFSYGSILKEFELDGVLSGLGCLDEKRSVVSVVANDQHHK